MANVKCLTVLHFYCCTRYTLILGIIWTHENNIDNDAPYSSVHKQTPLNRVYYFRLFDVFLLPKDPSFQNVLLAWKTKMN